MNAFNGDRIGQQSSPYTARISEASLTVVRSLIGETIFSVYASCLQVAGGDRTAPSFAIVRSSEINGRWIHRYIVFRCEWFETPHCLLDWWQMVVLNDDRPGDVTVDSNGTLIAPCRINFYNASPIRSIEIYSFEWSAGEGQSYEHVEYDQAICLRRMDGKSLCFACQLNGPGVATEIHLSEDEETITTFLSGSQLRLSFTS